MAANLGAFWLLLSIFAALARGNDYARVGRDWNTPDCLLARNPNQSPIDINYISCRCSAEYHAEVVFNQESQSLGAVRLSGEPPTIRMDLEAGLGFLVLRTPSFLSRLYYPRQMVFRTPSEHTKEGVQFPLEMQIFWRSTNDQNLATSIFFETTLSAPSSAFFLDFLRLARHHSLYNRSASFSAALGSSFEYQALFRPALRFFYYNGSFADTNCTAGLEWLVFEQHLQVNQTDLALFQNLLAAKTPSWNNSRAVQPNSSRFIAVGGVRCSDFYSGLFWFCFFFAIVSAIVFREM